jgi:magnesium transporter
MPVDRTKLLLDTIKRLLRRGATVHLHKIVDKTHAADLAVVFRFLTLREQEALFNLMDNVEHEAMLFSELEEEILLKLIEDMPAEKIAEILEQMPTDDVADLIGKLSDERAKALLDLMTKEGSEEVEGLLGYDAETAGGIMVPDFIALKEDTMAREAIKGLQKEYVDVEMPFYLYVVDDHGHLVGVISLRQLVVVPPETTLKSIMATDAVSVQTNMDQEEVARIVAHYNILAVPVVDENNKLVGIVTVDDVIDIIREEATEDILKMAGAGEDLVESQSILKSTRIRLPWLLASWIGGVIAFFIIGHFESSLNKLVYLAAFIPIIMGMGGNIGTQSSTIVVRGLATGRLNLKQIWEVVLKELAIGALLGFFYGSLLGFVVHAAVPTQQPALLLGVTVGLAVISSMTIAAMVGSLVPMVLARINIDPAVATGPFVTTSIDIVSVFFYFQIATVLLHL